MTQEIMIEPTELYNILCQKLFYSKLSDPIYVIILDVRNKEAYNESHVITSRRLKTDNNGKFIVPFDANLECREHVIVYDSNTTQVHLKTPATIAAQILLLAGSRNPVKIVKGGYERFSALYPFLRTQKIIYMPRELDDYEPYPIEVIPQFLYLGTQRQASSVVIQKHLKIAGHVNCTTNESTLCPIPVPQLYLAPVSDTTDADLFRYFSDASTFIDAFRSSTETKKNVLIYSDLGISRSITIAMAYLIYMKFTLQDAWNHLAKCSIFLRPNRAFVQQLSKFETEIHGATITDISDPLY